MLDLREKHPKIFEGIHRTNYSFPEKWYHIIDNLCLQIQLYCDTNDCEQIKCEQIKEKFGGLRFYVNYAPDEVQSLIQKAEQQAREYAN